jgi:hypothetical protein
MLTVHEEGIRVADLGSRNGTLLNGRPLGTVSRDLRPGDVVGVGNYVLKFEPDAASVTPPPREGFITLRAGAYADNPFTTRMDLRVPPDLLAPEEPAFGALLFQLAEMLAAGAEPEPFLDEVVVTARGATGFEGGVLVGSSVGALRAKGPVGMIWSRTLLETAIERRSALLVAHIAHEPGFNATDSILLSGHLHVLCAPLFAGERLHGALYLFTRSAPPPSQGTVEFIGSLARLAATALDRRRSESGQRQLEATSFARGALAELAQALDGTRGALGADQVAELRDLLREAQAALQRVDEPRGPTVALLPTGS